MIDIRGKNFLIIGLGETGYDAAITLFQRGANVRVTEIRDTPVIKEKKEKLFSKGVIVETGKHSIDFVKWADIVVPSPGVALDAQPILWAKEKKIKILSEIEIAYQMSPSKKIIAITGTNGKTTTVSFTDLVFTMAQIPHVACGNIGNSFIGEIDKIQQDTWIILEVSSFQLEYIEEFRPFIGAILNITDDHLDYYKDFSQYVEAKKKIFINSNCENWAILNYENIWCRKIGESKDCKKIFFSSKGKIDGIYLENGFVSFKGKKIFPIDEFEKSHLKGSHNLENVMAVVGISQILGISESFISQALLEFTPAPHRLEKVAEINGITFIDDSKATNVDAVCRALESFQMKNNIILILGGKDKGISFAPLKDFLPGRVKKILVIGEATSRIENELKDVGISMERIKNFEDAVRISLSTGKPGDILLLSPGCSSFDMFTSYAERGDVFKSSVKNLL